MTGETGMDGLPLELSSEQVALLRAIEELASEGGDLPSTKEVGLRLREIYRRTGGSYFWSASAPWHGTAPMVMELSRAGLIEVEVGAAPIRPLGSPASVIDMFWLGLTDAGRQVLAVAEGTSA